MIRRTMRGIVHLLVASAVLLGANELHAAIAYDGDGGTNWWFDPLNWSRETPAPPCPCLPPSQDDGTGVVTASDAQINGGSLPTWDLTGEGVVYDPANDPFFAAAAGFNYPTGSPAAAIVGSDYGPEHIYRLYIARNVGTENLLTIKSGDLVISSTTVIGRSGSTTADPNEGRINQLGGRLRLPLTSMDIGLSETSGWGNGVYDYRAGIAEFSLEGGDGLRIAHGRSGTGNGNGRVIVHNPNSGGYLRTWDFNNVSYRGDGGAGNPDGVTQGVAVNEFHFENGGTRPVQVARSLTLNNGQDLTTMATMSTRLELVLNEAPTVNMDGVPLDLGLFDTNFDIGFGDNGGTVRGFGDINGDMETDAVYANADGSVFYLEGDTVSAKFGNVQYNWSISYTGEITWSDADNSVVASIAGPGTSNDVVLIGLSSEMVGVSGDFNNDGNWDCDDINALTAAIASSSSDLAFDMNGDGTISGADLTDPGDGWLAVGGANNPTDTGGNAFLVGDANLDGTVDVSDFNIWNSAKFTSTSDWCVGDFNADGSADVSDFNAWNSNKFQSSAGGAAVVPEPATTAFLVPLALLAVHSVRRRRVA